MKNYHGIKSEEIVFKAEDNTDLCTKLRVTNHNGKIVDGVSGIIFINANYFSKFTEQMKEADLGFELNED